MINKTCSIFDLKDNCITFAREKEYLESIHNTRFNIDVIVYKKFLPVYYMPSNVKIIPLENNIDIDYHFTVIHNDINKNKKPLPNVIGENCNIHNTVILDYPGNTYAIGPDGERVMMKHMGNVVIGSNVDIAPYCVIHTSTMSSTVIAHGVKICAMSNIGHNCFINQNTFLAPSVRMAGGSKIGKNCFIYQNVMINGYVNICDNVTIGMGSIVMDDITKPGIYYGNPCVYQKPYGGLTKTFRKIREMNNAK